ncbi:hypothetical protein EUAN_24310 [Andreesenia angusta]|uniref:Copper amine oxidase-like N-terminal domain-containing protein n=1 Tax=Andreesenia angusta TaxID=39480 RepID=A0A1S1V430_9FIRM|nr:stalk domain-containing protein [Andreesenia angusta]OHW61214.1 hypothetical protein EUAN_24310 [Andreesenia angusta]
MKISRAIRSLAVAGVIGLGLLGATNVEAAIEPKVVLDGKPVVSDVEPVVYKGRVMLPIRAVAEAMGHRVEYHHDTWFPRAEIITEEFVDHPNPNEKVLYKYTTTINLGIRRASRAWLHESEIKLPNGGTQYGGHLSDWTLKNSLNEKNPGYTMWQREFPIVVENRVMMPVRDIAEFLGASVEWDNDTKTAVITSGAYVPDPEELAAVKAKAVADMEQISADIKAGIQPPYRAKKLQHFTRDQLK